MRSARPLIAWLLLFGVSGSAVTGQLQPSDFEIVDSNGRVVGPLIEAGSEYSVVGIDFSGHSILALVGRNDFGGAMFLGGPSVTTGSVYFVSADCSGQAYIGWVPHPTTMEPQAIVGPSAVLYLATSTTAQGLAPSSVLRPAQQCTQTSEAVTSAIPATAVTSLMPPYVPPFTIRSLPVAAAVPAFDRFSLALLVLVLALVGATFAVKRAAA